jgi:hypothetical protein
LELERKTTGEPIDVELTHERFAEQALAVGDEVVLKPRQIKVFMMDEQPATKDTLAPKAVTGKTFQSGT